MSSIEERLSEIRSVRNAIWRSRSLLQAGLSDADRGLVEKQLQEQRSAFERLLAATFPFTLKIQSET
jgi:hypothetical protein